MPDITMCENKKCPLRNKCYRATATPDPYWQSFCVFEYKGGKCDNFWDNAPYKKVAVSQVKSSVEPATAKIPPKKKPKLQKWHILEWLTTNEDLIAFIQAVQEDCLCSSEMRDVLKIVEWSLRLRRPRMRLWLWKLHLQAKRNKK